MTAGPRTIIDGKLYRFHMFMAGACGVHWAHGPNNVMSVDFKESHFEFRVNQGSYGFFVVIIGFFIQKNMGLETQILSLSILAKLNFT